MTVKDIIYSCLFVATISIALFALVYSLSDIDCKFLQFSATGFREIMGVLVSAVALVITAYLANLAISAYGRIEKIKQTHDEVDDIHKKCIGAFNLISQNLSRDLAESLYTLLDEQIKIAEKNKNIEWKNDLLVRRARMSHKYPILDSELRIKLFFELAYIGDGTDIAPLEKIIKSEHRDIKIAAELALNELKRILSINPNGDKYPQ